jgi:hypothetical protein
MSRAKNSASAMADRAAPTLIAVPSSVDNRRSDRPGNGLARDALLQSSLAESSTEFVPMSGSAFMKEPFGDFRLGIAGTAGPRSFARGLILAVPLALALWAIAIWLL